MATIKLNFEAEITDEVMKSLLEAIGKTEKPLREIQVEISNVNGRISVKMVPFEEERK